MMRQRAGCFGSFSCFETGAATLRPESKGTICGAVFYIVSQSESMLCALL